MLLKTDFILVTHAEELVKEAKSKKPDLRGRKS